MSEGRDPWMLDRVKQAAEDALRRLSFRRARSYRAVFRPDDPGRDHEAVLADLRDFCFAERSPFALDRGMTERNIGRLEVWQRIRGHLQLSDGEISTLKPLEIDDGI